MSTQRFDREIGALLRSTESPVPQGAWTHIRQVLDAPTPASPSFQFVPALVVGFAMLSGLALHSSLSEPEAAYTPPNAAVATVAAEEIETPQPATADMSLVAEGEAQSGHEPSSTQAPVSNQSKVAAVAQAGAMESDIYEGELSANNREETTVHEGVDSWVPEVSQAHVASTSPAPSVPAPTAVQTSPEAKFPTAPSPQAASPKLQAAIQATNLSGYAPFEIDFKAVGHFDEVEWDFGPYGKSTKPHTPQVFDKPGVYTVVLSAFNSTGDVVSDMVTIEVHEGSNLVVPDSFTPNGDGINDHFKAEGVNIEHFQLTVIDNRGKLVFETRNILQPWVYEGYPSGPVETYIAIIKARGIDGRDYNIRQRINVIF